MKIEYNNQYLKTKEKIKNWIQNNENLKEKKETKCKNLTVDVGGTLQTLSYKTLIKYPNSVLGALFNNHVKIPKRKGNIFIDRDPKTFSLMYYYLTNLSLPNFKNLSEENDFFEELSFWKIPIKQSKIQFKFDNKWCSPYLKIVKSQTSIIKNSSEHGIVFMKPKMNIFNSFVEFKIDVSIPCKNKNHLYIGLVDETKYRKNFLESTFWKDSPCSYYWDTCSKKLIKIDEFGKQMLNKNGYGCEFEGNENKFAIEYNQKNRTVSFYRNNVNLGVAFHNVQPNLTPSIDVWFESGKISITKAKEPNVQIYL